MEPMARHKIIVNPISGRGAGARAAPAIEVQLRQWGVEFDLVFSERPWHAAELAQQAAGDGYAAVVAAGGDGTIGDVVNGLASARGEQNLGVVGLLPLGTANDLAANLGIPLDLAAAAQVIAAGKTRKLDLGHVNGVYFANNSAICFDGRREPASIFSIKASEHPARLASTR